jgi:hypothetical protein
MLMLERTARSFPYIGIAGHALSLRPSGRLCHGIVLPCRTKRRAENWEIASGGLRTMRVFTEIWVISGKTDRLRDGLGVALCIHTVLLRGHGTK